MVFPSAPDAAGGCGQVDSLGSPVADAVHAEVFIHDSNVATPTGIARARNGNWYVSSVLTGVIGEFSPAGDFIRRVLSPAAPGLPTSSGNPHCEVAVAVPRVGHSRRQATTSGGWGGLAPQSARRQRG